MEASAGAGDAEREIEAPVDTERLYLFRQADADVFRPIATGDIFTGSPPWAAADHEFFIISSHPCSMRQGSALRSILQVMPVGPRTATATEKSWLGNYRLMFLPDLLGDGRTFAAAFDLGGPIESASLDLEKRVASLTEYGVLVFFQRYIRHLTRLGLRVSELEPAVRPVLTEIELQEEWNRALVPPHLDAHESMSDALTAEAQAFDAFLKTPGTGGSLRDDLREAYNQPGVRRAVNLEINRRRGA